MLNLVSDANGTIPSIDEDLEAWTYGIKEKAAPAGYESINGYIEFTISENGAVTLKDSENAELTSSFDKTAGKITYTLTINNQEKYPAPTNVQTNSFPYFLILIAGLALAAIPVIRKKRG